MKVSVQQREGVGPVRVWARAMAFALVAGLGMGCGGEGPSALSLEEICALLPADELARITGGTDVSYKAGTWSVPNGCVYNYTADDGSTSSLILGVMTGKRVDNKTGSAALEHLLDEIGNKDAPPLAGVDTRTAVHPTGADRMVLAVDDAGRVVSMLLDSGLDTEQQVAITRAVLAGLAGG